jgi:hypothetical protein
MSVPAFSPGPRNTREVAMAGKIAAIEELLGDTITEVTFYRTPSGSLFLTKERQSAQSLPRHVLTATATHVGNIANKVCAAKTAESVIFYAAKFSCSELSA